jgi:hypothetical protein
LFIKLESVIGSINDGLPGVGYIAIFEFYYLESLEGRLYRIKFIRSFLGLGDMLFSWLYFKGVPD